MARSPSFAGVILAAGESSRMGTDKALLPWPPQAPGKLPSQGHISFGSDPVADALHRFRGGGRGQERGGSGADGLCQWRVLVINPDPSRGQFSSLQVGLHEVLNRGRDAAVITLVDRPPVGSATIQMLRDAFESAPQDVWAVVPEFSGKHGHPYLVGRELIEAFLQAPPTASARDIEHRYQDHIRYVAVDDPFVALNINTPEDYAALAHRG